VATLTALSILRATVLATTLLSAAATKSFAAVGTVTEQTGPTEIQRKTEVIPSQISSGIESNDAVVTAAGRAQITFQDNTKVQITEQSKLVIDSFVFDPKKSDAGRIGLKVAIGTARYASGQIAKNNPEHVKIDTPTASIAVRGTDFSMTVDELGRSLVILLPSCPTGWKDIDKDCKTGKIDVTTDAGTITLNKPFQATSTVSREQNPSKSVILKLGFDQINNMLILTPPKPVQESTITRSRTALDINFLDRDLLKFDDLNVNFLGGLNQLDINMLDTAFLFNMLDLLNSQLLENMLSQENQMLPGYKANKAAGLKYILDYNSVSLYRIAPSSFVQINVDKDAQTTVNITQDDNVNIKQVVNRTNGTTITVRQSK
jgi:hypothetical protein